VIVVVWRRGGGLVVVGRRWCRIDEEGRRRVGARRVRVLWDCLAWKGVV